MNLEREKKNKLFGRERHRTRCAFDCIICIVKSHRRGHLDRQRFIRLLFCCYFWWFFSFLIYLAPSLSFSLSRIFFSLPFLSPIINNVVYRTDLRQVRFSTVYHVHRRVLNRSVPSTTSPLCLWTQVNNFKSATLLRWEEKVCKDVSESIVNILSYCLFIFFNPQQRKKSISMIFF